MVRSTRITFRLPLSQFRVLERKAGEQERSLSDIIRDSLKTNGIHPSDEPYFIPAGSRFHYNRAYDKRYHYKKPDYENRP